MTRVMENLPAAIGDSFWRGRGNVMVRLSQVFFLLLLTALGCRNGTEPLLPLHPVKGQVVNKGVPVKGGSLLFQRMNDQKPPAVVGPVDQAGGFELSTIRGKKGIPGAPAGQYQVTYNPPVLGKDTLPLTMSRIVEIAAHSNEIRIDVGERE
jgi:hypothetical protein